MFIISGALLKRGEVFYLAISCFASAQMTQCWLLRMSTAQHETASAAGASLLRAGLRQRREQRSTTQI